MTKLTMYRNRMGLSQVQLSDRTGISPAQINRIEKGVAAACDMRLRNAAALARVLGIHAEDLLEDTPTNNNDSDDELE